MRINFISTDYFYRQQDVDKMLGTNSARGYHVDFIMHVVQYIVAYCTLEITIFRLFKIVLRRKRNNAVQSLSESRILMQNVRFPLQLDKHEWKCRYIKLFTQIRNVKKI